jgi:hypothetical protein
MTRPGVPNSASANPLVVNTPTPIMLAATIIAAEKRLSCAGVRFVKIHLRFAIGNHHSVFQMKPNCS